MTTDPTVLRAELLQLAEDVTHHPLFDGRAQVSTWDLLRMARTHAQAIARLAVEFAALLPEPETGQGAAEPVVKDFQPETETDSISTDRIEEIVNTLNRLTSAAAGWATGDAIDWVTTQPETSVARESDGSASVMLRDGTVIEFDAKEELWAPIFCDVNTQVGHDRTR